MPRLRVPTTVLGLVPVRILNAQILILERGEIAADERCASASSITGKAETTTKSAPTWIAPKRSVTHMRRLCRTMFVSNSGCNDLRLRTTNPHRQAMPVTTMATLSGQDARPSFPMNNAR